MEWERELVKERELEKKKGFWNVLVQVEEEVHGEQVFEFVCLSVVSKKMME